MLRAIDRYLVKKAQWASFVIARRWGISNLQVVYAAISAQFLCVIGASLFAVLVFPFLFQLAAVFVLIAGLTTVMKISKLQKLQDQILSRTLPINAAMNAYRDRVIELLVVTSFALVSGYLFIFEENSRWLPTVVLGSFFLCSMLLSLAIEYFKACSIPFSEDNEKNN